MSNWKKALVTSVLALSLIFNGCSLFPSNNRSNQPGPVRFKTTRKVPTLPVRPTKVGKKMKVLPTRIGKELKVLPTKVKVLPTKIGGTVKKSLNKMTPLPTPKVMKSGTR